MSSGNTHGNADANASVSVHIRGGNPGPGGPTTTSKKARGGGGMGIVQNLINNNSGPREATPLLAGHSGAPGAGSGDYGHGHDGVSSLAGGWCWVGLHGCAEWTHPCMVARSLTQE